VDAFNASDAGNATQDFWRSAENMTINTNGGRNRWGVSQAAPFRRMKVQGGLDLFPASYGWSSGVTNDNLIANFNSYESPLKPGIKWTNMANVSLGGQGVINTFVNGVGPQADRANPNR